MEQNEAQMGPKGVKREGFEQGCGQKHLGALWCCPWSPRVLLLAPSWRPLGAHRPHKWIFGTTCGAPLGPSVFFGAPGGGPLEPSILTKAASGRAKTMHGALGEKHIWPHRLHKGTFLRALGGAGILRFLLASCSAHFPRRREQE